MRKKALLRLAPMLTLAVIAVALSPTMATGYQYEHLYCNNDLAPGGTCPPSGSSEYAHLELNAGDDPEASHEVCIDEYLTNSGYTGETCVYYDNEVAHQYPGGEYGYPRAWNGGSVSHEVLGAEYGYHT